MPARTLPDADVLVYQPDRCYKGYTLFCRSFEPKPSQPADRGRVLLVDMEGQPVHEWSVSTGLHQPELRPDGTLYYSTHTYADMRTHGLYRLAPDSTPLWKYHCRIDHDYHVGDDGRILIHCLLDRIVPRLGTGLRRNPYLVEINAAQELLWEWHAEEHVQELVDLCGLEIPIDWPRRIRDELDEQASWAERFPTRCAADFAVMMNQRDSILMEKRLVDLSRQERSDLAQRMIESRTWDWAHNNTVEVLPETPTSARDGRFRAGNILFSYRSLDIIGVIDRHSGDIVWAWGPGQLDGQHQPTMLPNGHFLIFDNGMRRGWSRVIELEPLSGEIVWEYAGTPREDFQATFISGAQLLPNGNVLVCDGVHMRLFEVTREKEIVWEYRARRDPVSRNQIYRATRYAPELVEPLLASWRQKRAGPSGTR